MRKKYKLGLIFIGLLIVLVGAIGVIKVFRPKKENEKPKMEVKVISNIENYGYKLEDRDPKYMRDTFKELEDILNKSEIDEEEYAIILAKLFIIDFYTLNNKINKYDVGGLEYIYSSSIDSFKNKAMDTIYRDVYDNTYKDRVQTLPEITDVNVIDVENDTIKLNGENVDCYKITLEYSYKEDLGYDTKGEVYLVKNNEKLEVALYKSID